MTVNEVFGVKDGSGGLHEFLGVTDVFVDENGKVNVVMPITDNVLNTNGKIHGGTVFALCDIALGCHQSLKGIKAVTLGAEIHYYRPGSPNTTLTAIVTERKTGKTVSSFLIEVYDSNGKHLVDSIFTSYQ